MKVDHILKELSMAFESKGSDVYFGEEVTQLQHAVQSYDLAAFTGASMELRLGAFLHDIGHLLSEEQLTELGDMKHEHQGAAWLKEKGFTPLIVAVCQEHVNAKKYLCYSDQAYYAKLSKASKKTLEIQGGAMNKYEATLFENHPYFKEIILVRKWDDQAKDPELLPDSVHLIMEDLRLLASTKIANN